MQTNLFLLLWIVFMQSRWTTIIEMKWLNLFDPELINVIFNHINTSRMLPMYAPISQHSLQQDIKGQSYEHYHTWIFTPQPSHGPNKAKDAVRSLGRLHPICFLPTLIGQLTDLWNSIEILLKANFPIDGFIPKCYIRQTVLNDKLVKIFETDVPRTNNDIYMQWW